MAPTHNLNSAVNEIPRSRNILPNTSAKMDQTIVDSMNSANTLQSMLRGEIPPGYSPLSSTYMTSVHNNRNLRTNIEKDSSHSQPIRVHRDHEHSYRPYHCSSPLRTSLVPSPHANIVSRSPKRANSPVTLYGPFYQEPSQQYSGQFYDRASPAYESRSSPFQESGSPFIGSSPYYNTGSPSRPYSPIQNTDSPYSVHRHHHNESPYSPNGTAGSPYSSHENSNSPYSGSQFSDVTHHSFYYSEGYSVDTRSVTDEQPIDLSRKSEYKTIPNVFVSEENDCSETQTNGSLLRNLLQPGKHASDDYSSDSGRDSPGSDVYKPEIPITGTTRVTLAKKMVYPITSRVSDWLLKMVQFTKSIPEFNSMSQNDKMILLMNSWTRLLLLLMAENDYEFAVTPLHKKEGQNFDATPSQDEPTMKSVEGIQSFIRKCKNMCMDQKEYALMRMAVLFNAGNTGLDDPELVEKLNSAVQQLLQQHVTSTRPDDVMHYSRILMLLPSLYGINCRMVENLFCKRINTDMAVLLKEMLQNL